MKRTTKILSAGAAIAALSLAGAYAFADKSHGPGHGRMGMGMGHGMGHGMGAGMGAGMLKGGGHGGRMGQVGDPAEHLASAKAAIGIKAEQTGAWDAYAKVVTETVAERRAHRETMDHDAVRAMKPEDRSAFQDSMMKQRDEAQAKIKAAAETLLAQLDDAQKAKAQQALPGLAAAGPGQGQGMRHGMMGSRGMGHGDGMGHGRGDGMGPRGQR